MTTIQTQIPVIEIIKVFYTGRQITLKIINVEDIKVIEPDYKAKCIDVIFNKLDENGFHKLESYYDTDKSYIVMRFTNVIRNN